MTEVDLNELAYITGIAIGDGNLSNSNGRAVRLRITCDNKYPFLIEEIVNSLKKILPNNRVTVVKRLRNCVDVSCYSNKLESWLGWKAYGGPKHKQGVGVPNWIKDEEVFSLLCLRGLFQTDGSIYMDRGYKMVNFVTIIPNLAEDIMDMIKKIGFKPNVQIVKKNKKIRNNKYTIRISRDVEKFIRKINLHKK